MRLYDDSYYSHMPFVFENFLLHCRAPQTTFSCNAVDETKQEYQAYDIYCSDLDGRNAFYIGAGLGKDVITCSPNAYRNADGNVVLNYVAARMSGTDTRYYHYQRIGPTLQTLGFHARVHEAQGINNYCQSENNWFAYTVLKHGERSLLWQYDKRTGSRRAFKFLDLTELKRAVVYGETSVILTYVSTSHVATSALFDTATFALADIKVDGTDIYKSHLHGDVAYYAVRAPGPRYGMAIHANAFSLAPSSLRARASVWTEHVGPSGNCVGES